jgi:hypothetical protein
LGCLVGNAVAHNLTPSLGQTTLGNLGGNVGRAEELIE